MSGPPRGWPTWRRYRTAARSSSTSPSLPVEPPPRRFLVVGAGQSAADVTEYLHRSHPQAEVCAVFTRYGYTPADDSPFANRIFDPAAVDDYFGSPEDVKQMLVDYHRNTNYSVVDADLIEELYRRAYQEKFWAASATADPQRGRASSTSSPSA